MDWQDKMNQMFDYIEENLDGEIQLDIAARFLGCSMWELQRLFSFVTHTTLSEYIRGRRLALAADELQNGNEKIIDIAVKYGYDSPAAFSRAFGRQYGVTPSQARGGKITLAPYPKITFQNHIKERENIMNIDMKTFNERGYTIKGNAPVYFTPDMEKTCEWFNKTLGWYAGVVAKDNDGVCHYGVAIDCPSELINSNLTPFRGFHLFTGAPTSGVVGFVQVEGLEKLRQYVLDSGWKQVSKIEPQAWGANECQVTTIDGNIIRFFE